MARDLEAGLDDRDGIARAPAADYRIGKIEAGEQRILTPPVAADHRIEERLRDPWREGEDRRAVGGDSDGKALRRKHLRRRRAVDHQQPPQRATARFEHEVEVTGSVLDPEQGRTVVHQLEQRSNSEHAVVAAVDDQRQARRAGDGAHEGGEALLLRAHQIGRQHQERVGPGALGIARLPLCRCEPAADAGDHG